MDNNNQLRARVAALESQVDLLEAELMHLHEMLMRCGFCDGIKTLKETVEEYLAEENPIPTQQKYM
jgi:hypothetical protein